MRDDEKNDYYVIAQISFSGFPKNENNEYAFIKLDPFRGNQKKDESSWETASRECKEETHHLIDLTEIGNDDNKFLVKNGIYHLLVHFESSEKLLDDHQYNLTQLQNELREINDSSDKIDLNTIKRELEIENLLKETFGIAIIPHKYINSTEGKKL